MAMVSCTLSTVSKGLDKSTERAALARLLFIALEKPLSVIAAAVKLLCVGH